MSFNQGLVNFVIIRRQFDFRGIEMGRWVTPEERDRAAVNFYRALEDLMSVLQGPELLISLRGTLGLQYGKGGRPGVAAHYVPATRQLSLAKNAGAGSLAHEWFHAFDHYMGEKMFQHVSPSHFASTSWLNNSPIQLSRNKEPHPLSLLLAECFRVIMLNEQGDEPSNMFKASRLADQKLKIVYYDKPEEMTARAFEAFVEDTKPTSTFLVKGSRHSEEAKMGLYPQGEQRHRINQAFHNYFGLLGRTLMRA
ncbi:CLCA_X family protein [Marinomonas sp.]|uniref:CLCA_X family protein n=1 Tax=Marinomonas sp. TaxID=1904862 RepID=UPI003BAC91EC